MISRFALTASAAVLLSACGAANTSYDKRSAMAPMAAPEPVAMAEETASGGSESGTDVAGAVQYIAYSHSIGIQLPVKSVEPTMLAHVAACNAAGPTVCVVTNSSLSAYSEDQASAQLYLRASPAWIETFLNGVEAEAEAAKGEITNRQTVAEDLTITLIDTDARLKAQTALQGRIQQLLADRPGNLTELLETERELARINGEIDSLTSSLAALRQRVDMSQLSVDYQTKIDPLSGGALSPIGDAFGSFFYNLSRSIAWVITAFASGLPVLLLLGALLWIWLRLIWPRIRRKKPPAA